MAHTRSFILARSLASALIVLTSCGDHDDHGSEAEAASTPVVSVRVDAVTVASPEVTVEAFGTTEALRQQKVHAPLAGRLVQLSAFEGTPVRRGDMLAVIMTKESQAALLGAETLLRSASTEEQRAEAERMVALARSSAHSVTLTASINGIIATRSVSEGEVVSENQELCTIIDPATIVFFADVLLRDLVDIRTGEKSRIVFPALGSQVFPACVVAVAPTAAPEGQTVRVRLDMIGTSPRLRSSLRTGMNGTATIVTDVVRNALMVPRIAVLRDDENDTYAVVMVTADSLALHVPVMCGVEAGPLIQISGHGVVAGLPVITEGAYALADSTKVSVVRRDAR